MRFDETSLTTCIICETFFCARDYVCSNVVILTYNQDLNYRIGLYSVLSFYSIMNVGEFNASK